MKIKIFSVYDAKTHFFGTPFFDQTEGNCIRSFSDAVNSNEQNNGFNKHPEDYSLWLLGEFDNIKGEFDCGKPSNLVNAAALKISPVTNKTEMTVN